MNRRDFIKTTILSVSSLATISLLENPLMAYDRDTTTYIRHAYSEEEPAIENLNE